MKKERLQIGRIPALLWGDPSDRLYLCLHGQGGCKEEAENLSSIACPAGWQVLSIDLPGHGERQDETDSFDPWHVVPELRLVMQYAGANWNETALFANSIGAWFAMLAFGEAALTRCLMVSPVLNMARLIETMMGWAGVTEGQLRQERIIPTAFGQTLSWEYLTFARNHPITDWKPPTAILYAGRDNLTERSVVDGFARQFHCRLTVMEDGEHWFHTPEQLEVLTRWVKQNI